MTSRIRQTGGFRRPRSLSVADPIQRDVEVSFTRQNATKLNITPLSRCKTIVTMKFSAASVLALAASASAFAPAPQGNVSLFESPRGEELSNQKLKDRHVSSPLNLQVPVNKVKLTDFFFFFFSLSHPLSRLLFILCDFNLFR